MKNVVSTNCLHWLRFFSSSWYVEFYFHRTLEICGIIRFWVLFKFCILESIFLILCWGGARRVISLLSDKGGCPGFSLAFLDNGEGALLLLVKIGINISAQIQHITSPYLVFTRQRLGLLQEHDVTFTSI